MDKSDLDRKRKWKRHQREAACEAFPISDALLQTLFSSVEELVNKKGCDHSLRFTEQWITENKQLRELLVSWLQENGGFCDCEVVANSYDHWEQNK